jgi:SSS family solute:Na+ symporter
MVYPPIVSGIVLAALLSAVMSSAVTCLLSASTIFNVDILKRFNTGMSEKQLLNYSRYGIVIIGLGAMFLALELKGIISTIMWAYTIFTTGIIIPVAAGFYKDKLRVTPTGALAAVIGGGLTGLLSKILTKVHYLDIGALLVAILILFIVSFIDVRIKKTKSAHLLELSKD